MKFPFDMRPWNLTQILENVKCTAFDKPLFVFESTKHMISYTQLPHSSPKWEKGDVNVFQMIITIKSLCIDSNLYRIFFY